MPLEQDFYNHLTDDPKKAHKIFAMVKPAITTAIAAAIAALKAALVYNKGTSAYRTSPLIQTGREAASTTSVTFPVAFKSGTEPIVILTSLSTSVIIQLTGTPTATGFVQQGKGTDGTTQNQDFEWIAIGEKA
jgi:hypothetical protein